MLRRGGQLRPCLTLIAIIAVVQLVARCPAFTAPVAATEAGAGAATSTASDSSLSRRLAAASVLTPALMLSEAGLASAEDAAAPAPTVDVTFEVNLGGDSPSTESFTIRLHSDWAPIGTQQFLQLLDKGWYDGAAFFRIVPGFVAQFGLPAKAQPRLPNIKDDPVKVSNKRGTLVFATAGPNSRTSQLFINYRDNSFLDKKGFSPFGEVLGDGMQVVEKLYSGYGEKPNQGMITAMGASYLDEQFPKLSKIVKASVQK